MFLRAALARARHDLGKYVCFETRWLGDDADEASLRSALQADLLHTRRSPSGDFDVAAVWADVRTDIIAGAAADGAGPDLAAIDARVAALAALALRLDALSLAELRNVALAARSLAEAVRALG